MSMNLNAETKDGRKVTLWQTPTWVSYCCWLDHEDKPRKWKDTRHLYAEWVKSKLQGAFEDGEYDDIKERVDEHLNELYSYKKLEFYVM